MKLVPVVVWLAALQLAALEFSFELPVVHAKPPGFKAGPQTLDLARWRNKRVMFIAAHPDDIEYFAGGTIATLRERALNVTIANLIVTTGNAGGVCYNMSTGAAHPEGYVCEREELAFIRRREMIAAGLSLGVTKVWRGGFDDGMLISYHESAVRERISAYVRAFQPHVIITHYPYPNFEAPQTCNGACNGVKMWDDLGYHPDHKRVGWHVLNAAYGGGSSASNDKLFEELAEAGGLRKWKAEELYFFALTADQPITHYVVLTNSSMDRKVKALLQHHSQYPSEDSCRPAVEWTGSTVAAECDETGFVEAFQGFF